MLYCQHRPLLMYAAAVKFRVPDPDAEALVHDAMISLLTTREAIDDIRAWLVAVVCNGSRRYWRCRARFEALPRDLEKILDSRQPVAASERLHREVLLRQVLARLRPKEQRILYLHYFEQRTATEIACALGTTPRYAERLIVKTLRRVRRVFMASTTYQGVRVLQFRLHQLRGDGTDMFPTLRHDREEQRMETQPISVVDRPQCGH